MPAPGPPTPYCLHEGLAVYRFGDGEPILLMPGPHRFQKPGDRTADALIDGLVRLGRAVVTFDPPASGRSTRPARLSMAEMHGCAGEALEICEVSEPVDAMGHSMAGLAVLAYALERPARVKRLVLVGTGSGGPAYMDAPGALWNRSHPAFWRMAALGVLHLLWPRLGSQKLMLNFITRQSFVDKGLAKADRIAPSDWLRPRVGRTDWHRIASKLDYVPRLGELEAPTLVLCGRFDPQYPPAASEALAAGIKNAQVVFFERSGHYPFIEESDAFWQAVGSFLSARSEPNKRVLAGEHV
jgi:pimeloyl-ACP methyl ester carboxylesterase